MQALDIHSSQRRSNNNGNNKIKCTQYTKLSTIIIIIIFTIADTIIGVFILRNSVVTTASSVIKQVI